MSLKLWPFWRMNICSRSRKFASTLSNSSWLIIPICLRWCPSVLLMFMAFLRIHVPWGSPKEKKSHIERSDDRKGQGTSPHREMRRSGNMAQTTVIAALAVWAVAPSCWNHTFCFLILRLRSSGSKKLLIIPMYRAEFTVVVIFLKKYRPMTPTLPVAQQTVTFGLCNGLSCTSWGFCGAQYRKFCLFTEPFRWKCSSSLIMTIASSRSSIISSISSSKAVDNPLRLTSERSSFVRMESQIFV